MLRGILAIALCVAASCVHAQDATNDADARKTDDATTLDTVRVTAPRPDTIDLYKFRNPIDVEDTAFGRAWHEPPSLEEIGKGGGIIPLLVGYVAQKVAAGAKKLPGWKDPIQYAAPRPPPLDDAQMQKAARLTEVPTLQPAPSAPVDAMQALPGMSPPR